MIKYQVTLFDVTGKHRPVASIVEVDRPFSTREEQKKIAQKGTEKICIKRRWRKADLLAYGYRQIKMRKVED